jgi:glyoxylase-like metal-dependent hydrolase (beta-lactamase superfamily II)
MAKSNGIKALVLEMDAGGRPFVAHAGLLWDEKDVVLVDTGIPGQLEVIRVALAREGFDLEQLTKVIITHHDRDHLGSLPELAAALGGKVEVLAHQIGVPFIQGEVPLLKSGTTAPYVKVDQVLQDGDELPFAGGVRILHTPGHTPDHISLYHPGSQTLLAGDALTSENGVLMPPNGPYTLDMEQALKSVLRLSELDLKAIVAYHGGVVTDGIRERLTQIAAG